MSKSKVQAPAPPAADELRLVPMAKIKPSPLNPRKRFDEASLAELAESIRAKGVIEPVILRPRALRGGRDGKQILPDVGYELVAGERRVRAAAKAGLAVIPAIVRRLDDKEVLEVMVIENEQRSDTTPLEKSAGYRALVEQHGYSVADLVAKVGKSESTIRGLLKLADLPDAAKKALDAGDCPATTALLVARVPDPKARAELAHKLLSSRNGGDPASFRQVKEYIEREHMIQLKAAPFGKDDAELVPEAGTCTACPKRTGNAKALYPDSRADICTDPACFRQKVDAHHAKLIAAARAEGKKVLDAEKCKQLWDYHGETLRYGSNYYDLAEQLPKWQDAKERSYKQLLEPELADQVVLALDQKGRLHRLVPKEAAQPVLETKLGKNSEVAKDARHERERKAEEKKKRRQEAIADKAAQRQGARRVAVAVETSCAGVVGWSRQVKDHVRAIAVALCHETWSDVVREVCKRRGLELLTDGPAATLAAFARATDSAAINLGLVAELLFAKCASFGWDAPDYASDDWRTEFYKAFGIDRKKLLAECGKNEHQ